MLVIFKMEEQSLSYISQSSIQLLDRCESEEQLDSCHNSSSKSEVDQHSQLPAESLEPEKGTNIDIDSSDLMLKSDQAGPMSSEIKTTTLVTFVRSLSLDSDQSSLSTSTAADNITLVSLSEADNMPEDDNSKDVEDDCDRTGEADLTYNVHDFEELLLQNQLEELQVDYFLLCLKYFYIHVCLFISDK